MSKTSLYLKFIDDGTLAGNTAKITQMAEGGIISNQNMHRLYCVMLDRYWKHAINRWEGKNEH